MLDMLDTLIATIGVVFVLSLVVQAVQQIIKQLFSFKSRYMESELLAMFGAVGPTIWSIKLNSSDLPVPLAAFIGRHTFKNRHIVQIVDAVKSKLGGFGYTDVSLLEGVNKEQFLKILGEAGKDLIEKGGDDLKAAVTKATEDAKKWYDFTLQAFQDHYERRMKGWAYVISFVLTAMLNVDVFDVYQEFQVNRVARESAVRATEALVENYDPAALEESSSAEPGSGEDIRAEIGSQISVIDSLVSARSFQLWRWGDQKNFPLTFERFFSTVGGNLPGIILMALLVGLGAPFWYDILKTVMGLKVRAVGAWKGPDPGQSRTGDPAAGEFARSARETKVHGNVEAVSKAVETAAKLPPPSFNVKKGREL